MKLAIRAALVAAALLIGWCLMAPANEPDDSDTSPSYPVLRGETKEIQELRATQRPRKCPSIWIPVPNSEQGEGFLCQPRKPHKMQCAEGYEWQEKSAGGIVYLVGCVPSE